MLNKLKSAFRNHDFVKVSSRKTVANKGNMTVFSPEVYECKLCCQVVTGNKPDNTKGCTGIKPEKKIIFIKWINCIDNTYTVVVR